jgi:lambda family phage portal protein
MSRRLPKTVTVGRRTIAVPLSVADRLVNWFSPTAGADRFQARLRMAALHGGYEAADTTRRANVYGGAAEMDADSAILPDLVTLREESHHVERNTSIGAGVKRLNLNMVVGAGLRPKAQINRNVLGISDEAAEEFERRAEQEFNLAAETVEIDHCRRLTFRDMQAVVFIRQMFDGDSFVSILKKSRPGSPYRTRLQLIDAARVCNPDLERNNKKIIGGIEVDSDGAPVACHVASRHPGARRGRMEKITWQKLAMFRPDGRPLILQIYDKQASRPGQTRGVPELAPVVELIKQLGRYTDAEIMAAVVTGMLTVMVESETGSPNFNPAPTPGYPDKTRADQPDTTGIELGYGSVVGLPPNTKANLVNPLRPNNAFDPFFFSIIRQIGMALGIPTEILIAHFSSSYSASKGAFELAWANFRNRRCQLTDQFCRPIWAEIITEAIAARRLNAPGFFSDPLIRAAWLGSVWIGDARPQLDELKEVNAAAKRIDHNLSTHDEESRRLTGIPWEDKWAQIQREKETIRARGLDPAQDPPPDTSEETDEPA